MAAAMSAMPASINGSDSSVPIVNPPHRKPSWGSGSRKCSQIERATRIAEAEGAEDEARPLECAGADEGGKQHEQQQPFKHRLVQLARVTRHRAAGREHHRPRQVGGSAPKLAVDEIGDAAEKDPDRSRRAGDVAERKDGQAAMTREQDDGEHAAEKAAVKRHAALPELKRLQRVCGEISRIVKQHVAEPSAQDDTERNPQHEVIVIGDGHRHRRGPQLLAANDRARVEPAQQDPDDVSERIPADDDRPEADEHGIDGGEGEGVKRHRRLASSG